MHARSYDAARKSKINTYTRIINDSPIPFNEEDERNVSTNRIAAHLGINPGNPYYHFRNKDEIIAQLFKRYSEASLEYLNDTTLPSNVEDSINYMADIYDVMWECHFLFNDVNTLLARNSELLGEHNSFIQARVSPLLVNPLPQLNSLNIIRTDQIAMNDLAVSMWIITRYWFDFDSSLRDRAKLTRDSKTHGIRRTFSLLRPYLPPQYIKEFDHKISAAADISNP